MSNLMDRVSRLKSMAGAMKLNAEDETGSLLLEMLSLMGEMAEEMSRLSEENAELNEYVETLDDRLADLTEAIEAEDEEDPAFAGEGDEDEDESLELEEGEMIIYACPSCGHEIEFDPADVDFDEDYLCPACGKPIFPEVDEDE